MLFHHAQPPVKQLVRLGSGIRANARRQPAAVGEPLLRLCLRALLNLAAPRVPPPLAVGGVQRSQRALLAQLQVQQVILAPPHGPLVRPTLVARAARRRIVIHARHPPSVHNEHRQNIVIFIREASRGAQPWYNFAPICC